MNKQRLTVCHADIERFNVATRNLSLDELVDFLQGYYELAGDVLLAHNGRMVRYMGDAVLALFDPGKEEIACRAMWALSQAYDHYIEDRGSDAKVSRLAVGIATGEVVVGQFGHPQMLAYDVLGRTVTVASALLNCSGIVMDAATHDVVEDRINSEIVGSNADLRGFRLTGLR